MTTASTTMNLQTVTRKCCQVSDYHFCCCRSLKDVGETERLQGDR